MRTIIIAFIFALFISSTGYAQGPAGSNKKVPDNLTKHNDNSRQLKIKAKQVANNTGELPSPKSGKNNKERKTDKQIGGYSGDQVYNNNKERKTDKQVAGYSGDQVYNNSKQHKTEKQIANYSGDVVLNDSKSRRTQKEIANYSGDMEVRGVNRETQKNIAHYSGDISVHDINKREKQIRQKGRKVASYEGDILVRTLEARARKIRKKSKEMANWEGDIIVKRVKKGMHPSAVYRGGNVKNSYAAKERYRKRMLKKYGKNEGAETPNYMKKKEGKPKYDKRESEIWY